MVVPDRFEYPSDPDSYEYQFDEAVANALEQMATHNKYDRLWMRTHIISEDSGVLNIAAVPDEVIRLLS